MTHIEQEVLNDSALQVAFPATYKFMKDEIDAGCTFNDLLHLHKSQLVECIIEDAEKDPVALFVKIKDKVKPFLREDYDEAAFKKKADGAVINLYFDKLERIYGIIMEYDFEPPTKEEVRADDEYYQDQWRTTQRAFNEIFK